MSGTTTTTSNQNPWAAQQPYLTTGFAAAQNLLNNKVPQYYGGSTLGDLSTYRQPAMNAQWNLGAEGTPEAAALSQQGMGLLSNGASGLAGYGAINNTANGGMLSNVNPYFTTAVNNAIQTAQPSINANFAATGRLGSGAHANAFADAATRIAGDLGYQDYSRERGYQHQAAMALPGMDMQARSLGAGMAQYADQDAFRRAGLLSGVADFADKRNQDVVDADKARWDFEQRAPWQAAKDYMSLVGGNNWGGTATQTQPGANEWLQWASVLAGMMK